MKENRMVFRRSLGSNEGGGLKPSAKPKEAADLIAQRQAADPSAELIVAQADPRPEDPDRAEKTRAAIGKTVEEYRMYHNATENLRKDISTHPEGFSIHYTVNGETDADPAKINLFDQAQGVHMTVHLNRRSGQYRLALNTLADLQKLAKTPRVEKGIEQAKKNLAQLDALIDNNIPICSIFKVAGNWQIIFTAKDWLGKKSGEETIAIDVNSLNNADEKWKLSELMKEIAKKVPGRLKVQTIE